MYVYIYMYCMHVCMSVCMKEYMCVWIYLWIHVCLYVCVYAFTLRIYICTHMHRIYICTHMHTHVCNVTNMHIYTCKHTHTHIHTHTKLHEPLTFFCIRYFPLKMLHPEIHQIEKLRFLGISWFNFKLRFGEIWIRTEEFDFLVLWISRVQQFQWKLSYMMFCNILNQWSS